MKQVALNFEGGLLDQFPDFQDCLKGSVYSCGRAFKAVAADMDMSVSELSRKLGNNPNDPVHFPAQRLPELLDASQNYQPIYWLIEKFIEDSDSKKKQAAEQLSMLLPQIKAALETINN